MIARAQHTPGSVASYDDVAGLQQKMVETVEELSRMADDVGLARHVLSFDADRRKQALARSMSAPLAGDESVSKAEAQGRASPIYAKELDQLAKEHVAAEQRITKWDALKCVWSTCQSMLAMQRESVRHL